MRTRMVFLLRFQAGCEEDVLENLSIHLHVSQFVIFGDFVVRFFESDEFFLDYMLGSSKKFPVRQQLLRKDGCDTGRDGNSTCRNGVALELRIV